MDDVASDDDAAAAVASNDGVSNVGGS